MEEHYNKWWGYQHINGSIQAKRYLDIRDLREAQDSEFVDVIVMPFDAKNREEALEHINKQLS